MTKTLLQINVVANSGSTGRIVEELGKLVMRNGWKSIVAYGRWACQSHSELIRIGDFHDVLWHGFKSLAFDQHGLGSARATRQFLHKVSIIKPDIIHLHNIHGYYINYPILFNFLAESGIPVIWTLHDCWAITGHCVHFQDIGCQKWENGCTHCPNIATGNYPKSIFLDNSHSNYLNKKRWFTSLSNLTIVPVCNWLDDIVSRSYLSEFNRKVIVNGIDLNLFRPYNSREKIDARLGTYGKFLCLAVASNWNNTKGLQDMFALRKLLPNEIVILMVGLTKKQIKHLPNNIIGLEKTESIEQLVELYNAADVYINPTYQDTLPTVNIEAIACGTPVISYNTGGCADIIGKGTGYIIQPGNVGELYNSIWKILQDGKKHYAKNCRYWAESKFNKEERFQDYMNLYESLSKSK